MSKFKLILLLCGFFPIISWSQGPCEFDVELPSFYFCNSENGFYLPILDQPEGTYSGQYVQQDGFYDAVAAGSGPHFVIYTADPNICIGTDTVFFYVLESADLEFEGGATSICAGDSTTWSAPNELEYDWNNNGVRTNTYTFSPDTTTTYIVSGLNTNGCPTSQELRITVFQFGSDLVIEGPNYVCYGDTVTYSVPNNTSILWSDGTTAPSITMEMTEDMFFSVLLGANSGCDTTLELSVDVGDFIYFDYSYTNNLCYGELFEIFITDGNAAFYKFAGQNFTEYAQFFLEDDALLVFEAYNDSGCFRTREIQLVVNDNPVIQIDAPEQLCGETPLSITASGAPVMDWIDLNTGLPVQLTGENEYNVLASDSISFQITGTNEFNCSTTAFVEVPVFPAPDVRIDSLTPFCFEREASVIVSGADNYVWNGLNTTPILTFTAYNDTVFTVLGSTIYGCFEYDTLEIQVHPNPEIYLTGEYYVCELDTATLIGSGAYEYFWDGVLGTDTLDATPSADSLFTLIGKNIFGCPDTATYFVDVDPAPVITFNGDPEICFGDSVSLQILTDALTFQWLGGSTQNTIAVDPFDDTTYTVTAVGANGCPRTSIYSVIVHDYPILSFSGSTTVCFGDTITLVASGADEYFWNNGQLGDTVQYVPVANSVLRVDGNSNDCITEEALVITVNEVPSVLFSFSVDTLCTSGLGAAWIANPAGGQFSGDGIVNNWFDLSTAINGLNTVNYTVTNEFNCSASASDQLIVETCLEQSEIELMNLQGYPNPCETTLTLMTHGQPGWVEVYDVFGKLVWSGSVSRQAILNVADWNAGTYLLYNRTLGHTQPLRVVKL
jgi:hypothetical protein